MIQPFAQKHYASAHKRMFAAVFDRFLASNFPQLGGPEIRTIMVDKIISLFEMYTVPTQHLKPGQMLWVGIDKDTRPDSKRVRFQPVVLTMVTSDEIQSLMDGRCHPPMLMQTAVARLYQEAFSQGALLSNRDIGLIYKRHSSDIAATRLRYEKKHACIIPTPATIQDMGSGVTHKATILRKILVDKMDMVKVREKTLHTQPAIDRYLKDYRRVEMLLDDGKDIFFIARVTSMTPYLIMQYEAIYKELKSEKSQC